MGNYADLLGFLGLPGQEPDLSEAGLDRLSRTGIRLVHCTSAPPYATNLQETIDAHLHFGALLSQHPEVFRIVTTKEDLQSPKLKVICGLQHCPVQPGNLSDLAKVADAGIRVMQITFGEATPFGGVDEADGLTEAGQKLLHEMAKNQIILDLSHVGSATAIDIMKNAQQNVRIFVSHTGCRSLYNHPRNLSDNVLKAVVNNGGIIGIYSITFFLHEADNGLDQMIRHICHLINLVGEDSVAVGSDGLVSGYKSIETWKEHFIWMKQKLDPDGKLGARWPDHPLQLTDTYNYGIIENALKKNIGRSAAAKVLSKNAFRFFEKALP